MTQESECCASGSCEVCRPHAHPELAAGWGPIDLTTPPPIGWGDEPLDGAWSLDEEQSVPGPAADAVTVATGLPTPEDHAHAKAVGERLIALAGGDPSVQDGQPRVAVIEPDGTVIGHVKAGPELLEPLEGGVFTATIADDLPAVLAADVGLVVRDWTDPDEVGPFASKLRAGVLDVVQQGHAALVVKRPEGRAVTDAVVAPELAYLGQTAATLKAVAEAILAGEKEARAIAGEVLVDVRGGDDKVRAGTVSARVSDQHGGMKVTRTQATETVVRDAEVVDVLVAALVGDREQDEDAGAREPTWAGYYAKGVREGIAALLELTSDPKWKVTALRAKVQLLEQQQRDALALRLEQSIGSKPKGNPQVTIERTPVKA